MADEKQYRMKIIKWENWRVEVVPLLPVLTRPDDREAMGRVCCDLVEQIERHVDVRAATVEYDVKVICSGCGCTWEVLDETGQPMCCQAAIDEWERETGQKAKEW